MRQILRVARVEALEQRRQPWMVLAMSLNYVLFGGLAVSFAFLFDFLSFDAQLSEAMAAQSEQLVFLTSRDATAAFVANFAPNLLVFIFTLPFAIVALSGGFSVLHDRDAGTLPFLMLAPLSRFELLLGKVLGALVIPLGLHFVISGPVTLAAGSFDVMRNVEALFGGSTAWWIAFVAGVPAGGLLMGTLAVIVSALSSDARTSYQFINFFLAIISIVLGYLVLLAIQAGTVAAIVLTVFFVGSAASLLAIGGILVSRDVAE